MKRALILLLLLLILAACNPAEQGIEGQLLFQGQPLAGAQLEVYLKSGGERSSTPFTVVRSDADGNYRLALPAGDYYLVGKLKQQSGGLNRMLMAEAPANPYSVAGGLRRVAPFELQEMGLGGNLPADPDTWVEGRLTAAGQPLADAFVYLYTENSGELMGPSYAKLVQADDEGHFRLQLPAGQFWLAARKRSDGGRSGELSAGDLNGRYSANPIVIVRGEQLQLADFDLQPVDQQRQQQRLAAGKFVATETVLSGQVVDDQGNPLSGIYVYAYLDSRMIGKPTYISAATASNGQFQLFFAAGGKYYIGARSTFGGPLEPGESVGTWDGAADHGITVEPGEQTELGAIQLREVW
jgi:uncharacterized GH25 family protein